MIKKGLTIAERIERINRKYYPDMEREELIDLLAYWWKVSVADINHAVATKVQTI